jgi:hypothetical protein
MMDLIQIWMDKLMLDYGMKILQQMIQLDFVLLNLLNCALMEDRIDSIISIGKEKRLEN